MNEVDHVVNPFFLKMSLEKVEVRTESALPTEPTNYTKEQIAEPRFMRLGHYRQADFSDYHACYLDIFKGMT